MHLCCPSNMWDVEKGRLCAPTAIMRSIMHVQCVMNIMNCSMMCVCLSACMHACVRVCVHACVCSCMQQVQYIPPTNISPLSVHTWHTIAALSLQEILSTLATAVASSTNALITHAQKIASLSEDQATKDKIYAAIKETADATQGLLTAANMVGSSADYSLCQEQLTDACKKAIGKVEKLVLTVQVSRVEHHGHNVVEAHATATKLLISLTSETITTMPRSSSMHCGGCGHALCVSIPAHHTQCFKFDPDKFLCHKLPTCTGVNVDALLCFKVCIGYVRTVCVTSSGTREKS